MDQQKKVVLIADDDPNVRKLVKFSIQNPAYDIIEATNGKDVLDKAAETKVDLAIIDALMPGLHGFEAARKLRELPGHKNIKIFILTSIYKQRQYELEAKLKYGVDEYLLKPFQPDDLRRRVKDALGI